MAAGGLFVTGTDTGVGKTAVAVAIVRLLVQQGLRVGVYKPVASGVDPANIGGDAARRRRTGLERDAPTPAVFE